MKQLFLGLLLAGVSISAMAEPLPSRPTETSHPGSANYTNQLKKEVLKWGNRSIQVYLPSEAIDRKEKLSLIVFGGGQAMGADSYELTFEHLARKGVAVAFPEYGTGFFDQNWRRMAQDYGQMALAVVKQYPASLDERSVIFAGHSKGAYVASVAAGSPKSAVSITPSSVLLFNPAGVDNEWIRNVNPQVPVSIFWSDADTIVKEDISLSMYRALPSVRKQYVKVVSYKGTSPELSADHFFTASKGSFFGGRDGISPFHFHGSWKWLMGAVYDMGKESRGTDPYLYGDEALKSGVDRIQHSATRNF